MSTRISAGSIGLIIALGVAGCGLGPASLVSQKQVSTTLEANKGREDFEQSPAKSLIRRYYITNRSLPWTKRGHKTVSSTLTSLTISPLSPPVIWEYEGIQRIERTVHFLDDPAPPKTYVTTRTVSGIVNSLSGKAEPAVGSTWNGLY